MKREEKRENETNSYESVVERFNKIALQYANSVPQAGIFNAFTHAGIGFANQPQIQNRRIKAISSLPADYSKEDIGDFLRNPYSNEQPLRSTSEVLRWTAYPYFKITKTYADIPSYRYYTKPLYVNADDVKTKEFQREAVLIDKINKEMRPETIAHAITGQSVTEGKVIYQVRCKVDKSHNKVPYAFLQQLPIDWCWLIGRNNVSGWTISFNMMYFLEPGTDWRQYGDLFLPYLEDFEKAVKTISDLDNIVSNDPHVVYCSDKRYFVNENALKTNAKGSPRLFYQNGRWFYYVSLPVDRVWCFEIDDISPAIASPLSGLMLTYSQQADYEAAQLSLLLNPLIKIFTGEIPYFTDTGTEKEDSYKLSIGGRALYEAFFNALMRQNNTGGTAFFTAPVENIKSHDYAESANANEISSSFNRYAGSKAGLSSLIPVDEDIKASQVEAAKLLESRFCDCIYRQFERMMNTIYESLNLKYDWSFVFFGSIYNDQTIRENAEKAIARGDTSAYFILSALDGDSILDKFSMMNTVNNSGILELLKVPQTSYTQTGGEDAKTGRPTSDMDDETDSEDTIDAREKAIDEG